MGLFNNIKNIFKKKNESNLEVLVKEIVDEDNKLKDLQSKDVSENIEETKNKEVVSTYEKGLTKSREGFVSKLLNLTKKYNKITEEYFEELEDILIMADIGVNTVMKFMDRLRDRVKKENIEDLEYLKEVIVDELFIIYVDGEVISSKINYQDDLTVILFVGVNGTGKTTTIGKLASKMKSEGKSVLMVAADTFRAGAINQLKEWADRSKVDFYSKEEGSDPASVVYEGIEYGKKNNNNVILIDTAGRLQNKVNLMNELEKINKVINNLVPGAPHETMLVLDATTGQNGISQAKHFKEITNITGLVLSKMDGTAKGGIVLAIKEELNIPVKFIGFGEGINDLKPFDIETYIYGLFKDMM